MMIVFLVLCLALLYAVVHLVRKRSGGAFIAIFLLFCVMGMVLGPQTGRIDVAQWYAAKMTCYTIARAEEQYAEDHGGHFPDGKSSTEVFQKLLDGNYVTDPAIFSMSTPGKTRASGPRLEPENVAYDVTIGINGPVPEGLPLVAVTGYKIDYANGGKLTPTDAPRPWFMHNPNAWFDWLSFTPKRLFIPPVIREGDGAIESPNSASPEAETLPRKSTAQNFNAQVQTYRQLTPEGPLK